jgi:hypothetical protein
MQSDEEKLARFRIDVEEMEDLDRNAARAVLREVDRLRGLIKSGERQEHLDDFGVWFQCAWCGGEADDGEPIAHDHCPAFHSDGRVR